MYLPLKIALQPSQLLPMGKEKYVKVFQKGNFSWLRMMSRKTWYSYNLVIF